MPELADVEHWRRYANRYAAGDTVESVEVLDRAVLRNTSPQGLGRAVTGSQVPRAVRRGKWLIVPFEPSRLIVHFGMTGGFAWASHPARPHEHDRVVFHLRGGDLAYRTQRKLGGVWLAGTDDQQRAVTGPLGPDARDVDREHLAELLAGRRGGIKSALMDQELLAGIGNELSDEILWRAKVAPRRAVAELGDDEIDDLADAMVDVLDRSVRHGHIPRQGSWVASVREDDAPTCPRCGREMRKDTVAGRTAVWCPAEQIGR